MRCMVCGTTMKPTVGGNYDCPTCGRMSMGTFNTPSNCDIPMPQGFSKQEGWICPVCGRGVAPWASSCPCQINRDITWASGTGTLSNNLVLESDTNGKDFNCPH